MTTDNQLAEELRSYQDAMLRKDADRREIGGRIMARVGAAIIDNDPELKDAMPTLGAYAQQVGMTDDPDKLSGGTIQQLRIVAESCATLTGNAADINVKLAARDIRTWANYRRVLGMSNDTLKKQFAAELANADNHGIGLVAFWEKIAAEARVLAGEVKAERKSAAEAKKQANETVDHALSRMLQAANDWDAWAARDAAAGTLPGDAKQADMAQTIQTIVATLSAGASKLGM